jgi:hypothetical protein
MVLALVFGTGTACAQTNTTQSAYSIFDSAPLWATDLRRGEIVAFGTFPFTMFLATFIVDGTRFIINSGDTRYAPWPFKPAGAIDMTDTEKGITITVAVAGSLVIALVDYFIVRHKRKANVKQPDTIPQF